MVEVHVVFAVHPDLGPSLRIPHQDVSVRAGFEHALFLEAEHPRRGRAAGFDPPLEGHLTHHDALVDQLHAMLHSTHPVRDLGKVAEAELFLVFEAERAVVRRHNGEFVHPQAFPEVLVMMLVLRTDRGRAHPLGSFESRLGEVILDRQIQVLGTGLGEHV